jgi:hypothetical protein
MTRSLVFAVLLAIALTGCAGRHFALTPPEHFVELEESAQRAMGYDLRALSADGVVIGVRQIDNDRHGSRAFWVDAVRNRLRRDGGYALLSESETRAGDGIEGHQMRFGRDEEGHPYRYWVTVFVTPSHVFVIEAGGREERFTEAETEIEAALATFTVR